MFKMFNIFWGNHVRIYFPQGDWMELFVSSPLSNESCCLRQDLVGSYCEFHGEESVFFGIVMI